MDVLGTKGSTLWGNPLGRIIIHPYTSISTSDCGLQEQQYRAWYTFGKHFLDEYAQWRHTNLETSLPLLPARVPHRSRRLVMDYLMVSSRLVLPFFLLGRRGITEPRPPGAKLCTFSRKQKCTDTSARCIFNCVYNFRGSQALPRSL